MRARSLVVTLVATAGLALAGAAQAADMYVPPEAPSYVPPPEAWSWSGAYFGVHGGYGKATFDGVFDSSELPDFPEEANFAEDLDARGFVGGLQAGYNHQSGSMVYGLEADVSLAGITDEIGDDGGNDLLRADVNVLASLRARIGIAHQQFLGYVTGGLAYAGGLYTLTDDLGDAGENIGTAKFSSIGGVVGGGGEIALGERTSLRLEGLYYIFGGSVDTSELTDDSDDGDFLALKSICVIRAGINFRL